MTDPDATPIRVQPLLIVETAFELPEDDDAWQVQTYLRCTGGSEGMSQVAGEISIEQPYGLIRPEYNTKFFNIGMAPDIRKTGTGNLVGLYVRLLQQDDDNGTIIRGAGIYKHNYRAVWWGQIIDDDANPNGAASPITGGVAQWRAAGIASLLDQRTLSDCPTRTVAGEQVQSGTFPPLNDLPGGDRSSATFVVNNRDVYIPDITTASTSNPWTAAQMLDLILAIARDPLFESSDSPTGPVWQVDDPDDCLSYIPTTMRFAGMTVAQAVNSLCSPSRGLVWWTSVSGGTVTINVRSTVAEAISVPGYTLPASTKTATIDQADGPWIQNLRVQEDQQSTYDVLLLRGNHPWVAISLVYDGTADGSLQKGWSTGLETGWGGNPNFSAYQNVWRRFEIRNDWDGSQYNDASVGLRNSFARSTDSTYGQEGLTGERSFLAADPGFELPSNFLIGENDLPVSVGFSTLRVGPRQRPVIVLGSGNAWYDYTNQWTISIQSKPFAILIDDGDHGRIIQGFLASGQQLIVTLGVREASPLQISWQRSASDLPRNSPRLKEIPDFELEQWVALKGCVTGTSIDGTSLTTLPDDVTARDDLVALRNRLPLTRAWLGRPDFSVSWLNAGELDLGDTYRAGTLLTAANDGIRSVTPNQIIVPRRFQLVHRDQGWTYDTTYQTRRILPDMDTVL